MYIKKIISIIIVFLVLGLSSVFAQQLQVSASVGFAGLGNPIDGIFTAGNVAVPTGIKGVSLNPSFSFAVNHLGQGTFTYYKNPKDLIESASFDNNPQRGRVSGDIVLFININPFKWFNSDKLKCIDMGMGVAYGVQAYNHSTYAGVLLASGTSVYEVQTFGGVDATYALKAYYNYHFDKYFVGLQLGVRSLKHEPFSTMGLQFGLQM